VSRPSHRTRNAIAALLTSTILLLVVAPQASALVNVNLGGLGHGAVTSSPAGINCSNIPGQESSECSFEFGFAAVTLTATPGSSFESWAGNAGGGTCNAGSTNPCTFGSLGFLATYTFTGSFEEAPPAPSVITGVTSSVSQHFATMQGTVDPEGGEVSDCKFEYGKTTAYDRAAACVPSSLGEGTDAVPVSARTGALEPAATYHYRLAASGPGGDSKGTDQTFTTGAASPNVQAFLPSGGTTTTFEGAVNPNNSATTYHFEYGLADCAGNPCVGVPVPEASVGAGGSAVPVSQSVSGLTAGATYHYRLLATNGTGTATTLDRVFTVPSAAGCSNEALRQLQASTYLPSCMAFEMVSPPQKGSQPAIEPSFSANGERLVFRSRALLGGSLSLVSPLGDRYIASRDAGGWAVTASSPAGKDGLDAGFYSGPRTFAPDLSRWLVIQARPGQFLEGKATVFERAIDGSPSARSPLMTPLAGPRDSEVVNGAGFQGVSGDLSHIYFRPGNNASPSTTYLPGDPQPAALPGYLAWNTYVVKQDSSTGPSVELLARDSSGVVWGGTCGTWVGGGGLRSPETTAPGGRNQGAISWNGTSVYFSTRPAQPGPEAVEPALPGCDTDNPIRILLRRETAGDIQISELNPDGPAVGSDYFEGASVDGSRVYFTSSRDLASTDQDPASEECTPEEQLPKETSKGCDLYLHEETSSGNELTQISAGGPGDPTPGEGANVLRGVAAVAGDGSHVYYVAQGALTDEPNPEGQVAAPGNLNLYAYWKSASAPAGHTAFVAELDPTCRPFTEGGALLDDCHAVATSPVSYFNDAVAVPMLGTDPEGHEVGGDGHVLVFISYAELTADDVDGHHRDIFRYDADAGSLECVSCRPGGSDSAPSDVANRQTNLITPGLDFAERQQWVSEDGRSIVFMTASPLQADDTDGLENPYLWRDGDLTRLPAARAPGAAGEANPRPTVSHSGNEVAFQTSTPLLPQDQDTAADIYVARVGGGFPNPPSPPPPCMGAEECRGPAGSPPVMRDPASGGFSGTGNVKSGSKKKHHKCPKGKRKVTREGKIRCVQRSGSKAKAKNSGHARGAGATKENG
jgi:WD40 repeat protein